MKKILKDPFSYVDDMLAGLCAAHPDMYRVAGDGRVVARADAPVAGKVGIVSGGGSGHLPIFTGYVGKGLLDACAIGDVFASPSVDQMAENQVIDSLMICSLSARVRGRMNVSAATIMCSTKVACAQ